MADYILGTASDEAKANFDRLQQLADQPQVQVFNVSNNNNRLLFFAFDGTGNNKDNPLLGPATNIAHLYDAAKAALVADGSGEAFYYQGPGTQSNFLMKALDGATGMSVPSTAADAYKQLVEYANSNPGVNITIGTTGFSRGAATARAFLNAVWENGIPDTSSRVSLGIDALTGQERFGYTRYIVEPQKADLGIAMLYDTVATGTARNESLMRIPPAPGLRVYQLAAEDERRSVFGLDSVIDPNNPNDSRISQWWVAGAHSNVGGGYLENGISLRTLGIGYSLLRNSGVPLADLPSDQLYNGQPLLIHDSFKGFYGPDAGPQTGGYVVEPRWQNAKTYSNLPYVTDIDREGFDDGSAIEIITYSNGRVDRITRDTAWQITHTTTFTTRDGVLTVTERDSSGVLLSMTQRQTLSNGNIVETVSYADGRTVKLSYDGDGNLLSQQEIQSAGQTLQNAVALGRVRIFV